MAFEPQVACSRCGQRTARPSAWRCDACGGPLWITNLPAFDADALSDEWTLWRYEAMLPADRNFSLGEGFTPVVEVEFEGVAFRAKLEFLAPTSSYKDRGTVVLVNRLMSQDVRDVVEDSSGNAGASLAAYAGAAGIRARVFVPAHAAHGKKRQISVFGAELVEVEGPRSAATEACLAAARDTVYASHAWSPFFLAGQMTVAWELWEQSGRRVPDGIVCPVGQGSLVLGLWYGFEALRGGGYVDTVPRLYGVQAAACDPIVRAWEAGDEEPAPVTEGDTIAGGIRIAAPVRGHEILHAIRASGGAAFRVDDEAIHSAQLTLARRGLYVEPTSAVPVAALDAVWRHVGRAGDLVVPLTGSGLKTPP